jgi:hypothetical protein
VQGAPLLLSWSKISEKFTISWLQTENIIIVEVGSVDYIFHVYVCDMRAYPLPWRLRSLMRTKPSTRRQRWKGHNEYGNSPMPPRLLSRPWARMLTTGMIQGTDLTPTDLHRAVHICGPSLISVRGGTRRHPAPRVNTDTLTRTLAPALVVIHLDILYVKGISFLLCCVGNIYHLMCEFLRRRTANHLYDVIISFVNRL